MRCFQWAMTAVAVVGFASITYAADMPAKMPSPAPAPVVAPSWTGFYLGVHAGWSWSSNASATTSGIGPGAPLTLPLSFNLDRDSPIAGLQIGYNYQFASWVLGIEGDVSGTRLTSLQNAQNISGVTVGPCTAGFPCGLTTLGQDIQWLASARGRIGYAWGPGLFYVTGGAAWAKVNYSANGTFAGIGAAILQWPVSFSSTASGAVVGGGYEWMLTGNWTLRGEMLHYWFNTTPTASVIVGGAPTTYTWSRFDVNVARLGLNYKFN